MDYRDFKNRLDTDKIFADKFSACDSVEELIKAAATEGYSFTKDDVDRATELSLDDLDVVAGGAHDRKVVNPEPYLKKTYTMGSDNKE